VLPLLGFVVCVYAITRLVATVWENLDAERMCAAHKFVAVAVTCAIGLAGLVLPAVQFGWWVVFGNGPIVPTR